MLTRNSREEVARDDCDEGSSYSSWEEAESCRDRTEMKKVLITTFYQYQDTDKGKENIQKRSVDHVVVKACPKETGYNHTHGESSVVPQTQPHQWFILRFVLQPPLPTHEYHKEDDAY